MLLTSEKNQPFNWLEVLSQRKFASRTKFTVDAVVMVYEAEIATRVSLVVVELEPLNSETWKVDEAETVVKPTTRTRN